MEEKIVTIKSDFQEKISSAQNIEEKIDLKNKLAWELRSIDTAYALEISEKAHVEAVLHDYEHGRAQSLFICGVCLCYLADYEQSFLKLNDALGYFNNFNDQAGIAGVRNWIGNVHWRIGNYALALEEFKQSYNLSEEIGDDKLVTANLSSLGRVYQELGDYQDALEMHIKSLELRKKNSLETSISCWDISRAYMGLRNFESAREYCSASIEIRSQLGDQRALAASMHVMGEIYELNGEHREALSYYQKALEYLTQVSELWGEARTTRQLGALYVKLNKPEKALPYLINSMQIAGEINALEIVYEAHHELAACYELMNDTQRALHHYKLFHKIKEEVLGKQADQTLKFYQRGFEIEKAQKEAEIIRIKNTELADALEEVKVLNEYLAQVNQNLESLNSEKNEMLGIVAHDLKNPLSTILMTASMIRTFREKISLDELDSFMMKLENTALHMKEIISKLLDVNAIDSGQMNLTMGMQNLTEILDNVMNDYREKAAAKNISVTLDMKENDLPIYADRDAAIQIVDNLVSNAIKFSPVGKNVSVHGFAEGDRIFISVKDEGPGFTHEDKQKLYKKFSRLSAKPSAGENSTGLGLSIVKKLVEVMGGNITLESEAGQGAKFIVDFTRA